MKCRTVALTLLILALGALPALSQTSNAGLNSAMALHAGLGTQADLYQWAGVM